MSYDITESTARAYYAKAIKEGYEDTDTYDTDIDTTSNKADIQAATDSLVDAQDTAITAYRTVAKTDAESDIDSAYEAMLITRSAAKTNMESAVDATSLSEGDKTSLKAALDAIIDTVTFNTATLKASVDGRIDTIILDAADLKSDITDAVNDGLPDSLTASSTVHSILDQITSEIKSAIATVHTVIDGRCGGEGRYSKVNDTGNEEDVDKVIHCRTCDGYGRVDSAEEGKPQVTWPEKEVGI